MVHGTLRIGLIEGCSLICFFFLNALLFPSCEMMPTESNELIKSTQEIWSRLVLILSETVV